MIAILLLAFFAVNARAQTGEKTVWSRIENDEKSFSIAIPPGAQIFTDKEGYALTTAEAFRKGKFNNVAFTDIRYLTASTGDASFYIIRYKTNNLKDAFRILSDVKGEKMQVTAATVSGFAVKVISDTTDQVFRQRMFIGYKDEIYEIFGGARNAQNDNLKYLFASIKFNNEKPFVAATALDAKIAEQTVSLAAFADTPLTVEEAKDTILPNPPPTPAPGVVPILVIAKLRAQFTEAARTKKTSGKVVLNVAFAADGSIEKILVVNGLPNGLTEQAVKVARMIRFLPEEKDGVRVSVTRNVEYTFSFY